MTIAVIIIILLTINVLYLTNFFGAKRMRFVVCTLLTIFSTLILFSISVLSLYATAADFPDAHTIYLLLVRNDDVSILFSTIDVIPEYTVWLLCALDAVFWFAVLSTTFVFVHIIYTITKKVIKEISKDKEVEADSSDEGSNEAIGFSELPVKNTCLSSICRLNC